MKFLFVIIVSVIFTITTTTINIAYAQETVASPSATPVSTPSATPTSTLSPSPTPTSAASTPTSTPTVVPTSPSSTPQPTQESTSKKEVLGEKTSVLGATSSDKELTKWFLAFGALILTVVLSVKVLRSNGVEE